MADETSKTRSKRLPKGQRIHVRRLKQAARKAGTTHSWLASELRPARVPKQEAEPSRQ
jgi:hypothetical protein